MTLAKWLMLVAPIMIGSFVFYGFFRQPAEETPPLDSGRVRIAHLASGDQTGLSAIQKAFKERNPGYEVFYHQDMATMPPEDYHRVLFIQEDSATITLSDRQSSEVATGDIVLLEKSASWKSDKPVSLLSFKVPDAFPDDLPTFIRPDWDPGITDIPGGCATDSNAYRRILLTWLGKVGPYQYHALNAHRVRIMDSFSHYHPVDNGFDEFYLVQMAMDDASIITSEKTDKITRPQSVKPEEADDLLSRTKLQVGDLVYLPRGVVHRGVDGVLAQVITVPGFIPKSEIGVDHHLLEINLRLGLSGDEALPYNEEGSQKPIVK